MIAKLHGPFPTATEARRYVQPLEWEIWNNGRGYDDRPADTVCVLVGRLVGGKMAYCWEPWASVRNERDVYVCKCLDLRDLR